MSRFAPIFLPKAIDMFGGIENYLRRGAGPLPRPSSKYPSYYASHIQTIGSYLLHRMARSGRVPVKQANHILWLACQRYSGVPLRSYKAMALDGAGRVVINEYGRAGSSFEFDDAGSSVEAATHDATGPWTDVRTRRMGGQLALCRWCQCFVDTSRFTKPQWGGYFCAAPVCRHLSWLAKKVTSRGGIAPTYRQRDSVLKDHLDVICISNFLQLKAKQAQRKTHEQRHSH